MGDPLTVAQAYAAGRNDLIEAERAAKQMVHDGELDPKHFRANIYARLELLYKARIDRGELPPLTQEAS